MGNTRRLWSMLAVLVLASSAAAQVKTSDITFASGDEKIKGYLAVPDGKGPFPAVVVIQEWWGLNDWIKENAKRLAEKGYVALAPDLYRGKVTDDMKVAGQLARGLPEDRALRDLRAAVKTLSDMHNVRKDRLGSIGWCMGGGYSLKLAINNHVIQSCVICYGRVVTDANELKPLHARVLGIFGEQDKGIPASSVREFEEALKKAGKKVERIHIFTEAGHGFMRANNGSQKNPAYRDAQARQAWHEIETFLAKTLAR